MYVNRDIYGEYKECLHCGNMEDIESPSTRAALLASATRGAKKRKSKVA